MEEEIEVVMIIAHIQVLMEDNLKLFQVNKYLVLLTILRFKLQTAKKFIFIKLTGVSLFQKKIGLNQKLFQD